MVAILVLLVTLPLWAMVIEVDPTLALLGGGVQIAIIIGWGIKQDTL